MWRGCAALPVSAPRGRQALPWRPRQPALLVLPARCCPLLGSSAGGRPSCLCQCGRPSGWSCASLTLLLACQPASMRPASTCSFSRSAPPARSLRAEKARRLLCHNAAAGSVDGEPCASRADHAGRAGLRKYWWRGSHWHQGGACGAAAAPACAAPATAGTASSPCTATRR